MAKLPNNFNATQYPLDTPSPVPVTPSDVQVTPANSSDPSTPADPWEGWGTHSNGKPTGEVQSYTTASGQVITMPVNLDANGNPIRSRVMISHLENGVPVIDHIPDGFTEEEADILREWFPKLWNKPSPHVTNSHGVVINEEDTLKHVAAEARIAAKRQAEQRKAEKHLNKERDQQYASAYEIWMQDCIDRKDAIEAATAEWRKRVAERKSSLAQWDQYVSEARQAMDAAKRVPVPERPAK